MRVLTTLQDVAREAGVSMKTVSRVVNNEAHVADDTRHQVLRVIAAMGYVPHLQAQRLASGRTRAIALHYPLEDPALISSQIEMDFITGIALGAADQEYFFSLMTGELTQAGLLKFCRGAHADGLVLMQLALDDWRVSVLRENAYPFVMLGRTAENEGLAFIDLDMEQSILDAYAHLVELGHRQIAFLTFSQEWRMRGIGPAMRGLRGFHKAVEKFEIAPLYRECELEVERARCATHELMTQHSRVTALIAVHNTLAVGAIRALNDLHRSIPEDCSILGVAIGKPELLIPPLTSLDFAIHEVGRQAAHMLIDQLKTGSATSQQVLVRPTLRLRGTTSQVRVMAGASGVERRL